MAYQYFNFGEIDGISLKKLPAVLEHAQYQVNGTTPNYENDYITDTNKVSADLHQSVLYAVHGVTNRLDVSAEVPIEHVHLNISSNNHIVRTVACEDTATCTGGGADLGEYHYFGTPTSNQQALANVDAAFTSGGDKSGFGDVILRGKYQVLKGEKIAASIGAGFRLPSGDERNFLGSGTFGVAPFGHSLTEHAFLPM